MRVAILPGMLKLTPIALLALVSCAIEAEPTPPLTVEPAEASDGVPCDLLKGPPELPAAAPTPSWRYAEEFDLIVGYAPGSPFLLLSQEDYGTFRDSMRFNEAGQITAYRYDVLQATLPPDEFRRAEEQLGRQPKDHADYDCIKRATCETHSGRVCMSAC